MSSTIHWSKALRFWRLVTLFNLIFVLFPPPPQLNSWLNSREAKLQNYDENVKMLAFNLSIKHFLSSNYLNSWTFTGEPRHSRPSEKGVSQLQLLVLVCRLFNIFQYLICQHLQNGLKLMEMSRYGPRATVQSAAVSIALPNNQV